jgi:hypothetical protein
MTKTSLPDFPFFWIEKPSMSSLEVLAEHLREKSQTIRNGSGFRGEANAMEKQIIEHLSGLEQQVFLLTDVVQASLQIISAEHERQIAQRAKRTFRRIWERTGEYGHRIWENTVFKVVGALGTLSFLITVFARLLHLVRQ